MTATSITASEAAERTAKPVLEFGRAWMISPGTAARAGELGLAQLGRFGFWVNGRAGVLGDVDAVVAASAIGFMDPDAVAANWHGRPDGVSAWECGLAWFGCGADWARTAMAPMPESRVRRLADLARLVVDRADPSVGTLFAGSTLVPLPGDPAGDAAITLNVLRELRGGAHLAACHAAGLGPHATIMSTDDPVRGGVPWAEGFGWKAPHPEPDPVARQQVEAITTRIMTRAFDTISGAERAELTELVDEARALLD